VEEVLHQGASAAEIAETLDIGVLMGGTLAIKSVRHAFAVMDAIKAGATSPGGEGSAR
jgi:alkylhydroperoxidase/carboxymuconolactone decarboxylase family protein YurZ